MRLDLLPAVEAWTYELSVLSAPFSEYRPTYRRSFWERLLGNFGKKKCMFRSTC